MSFISSLAKLSREGYVFSTTISKLFGIKQTINTGVLNKMFLKERDNLEIFYQKE